MTKHESVSADFRVIQRVVLESLAVTGYQVEQADLIVEPCREKWVIELTVVVERDW